MEDAAIRVSTVVYVPVPDNGTLCGLAGALSVKVRLPLYEPGEAGLKVTLVTQLAPGANAMPFTQGVTSCEWNVFRAKPVPVTAMLVMLRVAPPVLVTVTFLVAVVPCRWLPNFSAVGTKVICAPPPVVMVSWMVV